MDKSEFLGKEKVGKLILKFSIPCVLSLLLSALYNIVDQIFIGNSRVGSLGIAATTIVFPITVLGLAFGLMLGDGAAAYLSIMLGRGEKEKIGKAVGTAITSAIIVSLICYAVLLPLLDPILVAFGAKTPEALASAAEYGTIIVLGLPAFIFGLAANSIIRADGAPQVAMLAGIAGAVTNIVLDAVMINVLDWGLTGAALATILGQIVTAILGIVYLFRPKTYTNSWKIFVPDLPSLLEDLKLGASSLLTQISILIGTVVTMNAIGMHGGASKYGINDPQAILGIVMKISAIVINIVVGIAVGAQPVVGYNYGARNYKRVKEAFRIVLIASTVVALLFTVLFEVIPGPILAIFGSNSEDPALYVEFGEKAIRVYLMLILFCVVGKAAAIFYQSIDRPVMAIILSLSRDIAAFVSFTLLLPLALGLDGVLWAATASDAVAAVITLISLFIVLPGLKKEEMKANIAVEAVAE